MSNSEIKELLLVRTCYFTKRKMKIDAKRYCFWRMSFLWFLNLFLQTKIVTHYINSKSYCSFIGEREKIALFRSFASSRCYYFLWEGLYFKNFWDSDFFVWTFYSNDIFIFLIHFTIIIVIIIVFRVLCEEILLSWLRALYIFLKDTNYSHMNYVY